MRPLSTFGVSLVTAVLLALAAPGARADTYVIPNILEQSGTTIDPYHFDQFLYAFYGSGLAGTPSSDGATLSLYLYDNTAGNPMLNNGLEVCNPCSFPIGSPAQRKLVVQIENLILATGVFTGVKSGFGVLVVGGDAAGVSLESSIVNSHTSTFDRSTLVSAPIRLRSEDSCAPNASVFQITNMLEVEGKISNTQNTFDHAINAIYTAGLAGTPAGAGARIAVYLYDNTGNLPLKNQGNDVCNPCSFAIGGVNPRKLNISIDNQIMAQGPFDSPIKSGSAIVVVTGDAGNVTLQPLASHSHTSAFDVTNWYPTLTPVQVSEEVGVLLEPRSGAVTGLGASPNPASGEVRFSIEMARSADVELAIFDVAGRRVATVFEGRAQAGASVYRWNGAGSTGTLQGGVYFARLTSADGSSQARLVMRP